MNAQLCGNLGMLQERSESPRDKARRHVVEAEARLARQREFLRQLQVDDHLHDAETASRVLVTMEADVLLLCEHLRQVENLHPQD
ncbi:MAG TPA: hypothetical protein VGN83_15835 [Falsiroseomonas sp.]|nr:hypothetical protein [Falsiroseomonas sp.]